VNRIVMFLLASLCLATSVLAQSPDDHGKQLVDEFIEDVESFSGNFEQVLIDADGEVIERATGTLEISRPGKFRWSYIEPYEQWLIADGLNIWSYDVDLAQVTVKPQADALANTPALLLSGSADALDQFDYEGSYDETVTTWVKLAPKNTDSGFLRMELGSTLVEFRDVAVNGQIDPARFEFLVPDDVDVVGMPAVADIPES